MMVWRVGEAGGGGGTSVSLSPREWGGGFTALLTLSPEFLVSSIYRLPNERLNCPSVF